MSVFTEYLYQFSSNQTASADHNNFHSFSSRSGPSSDLVKAEFSLRHVRGVQKCAMAFCSYFTGISAGAPSSFHEEDYELRRLGFARVSSDGVDIVAAFIEGLTWCQGDFFFTLHLHNY